MKHEIIVDEQLMQTGGTISWPVSTTLIGSLTYTPIKLGIPFVPVTGAPVPPVFNTVDQIGEGSSAATGSGSTSSSDGMTSFFLSFFNVL